MPDTDTVREAVEQALHDASDRRLTVADIAATVDESPARVRAALAALVQLGIATCDRATRPREPDHYRWQRA